MKYELIEDGVTLKIIERDGKGGARTFLTRLGYPLDGDHITRMNDMKLITNALNEYFENLGKVNNDKL